MIRVVLLLFVMNLISFSVIAENITINHPSPYVRLHANDAVKWQRWDASVLLRAKKENKLILISSGYYACHWCHVMRRESFTDEAVAKILNEKFIVVKIDREINSALDNYLMNFMQSTQGYGGWPLNVFITPEGYPLTALVYLPKKEFISVVQNLNSRWLSENNRLRKMAQGMFEYAQLAANATIEISDIDMLDALMKSVNSVSDDLQGGIGNKQKFPMPYLIMSLLEIYESNRNKVQAEFIKLTLNQMLEQGLHDSVGGGFFRYTIDQGWQTPHFEKMLYTNAAMIKLYIKAYRVFKNKKWLLAAEETMKFVIREMKKDQGGYVSSLNAQDVSGEEGGNYVWHIEKLKSLLSKQQQVWLSKNVKFSELADSGKLMPMGFWSDEESIKLRRILMKKRQGNPPIKDSKMIVSWNAYLLSAMIELIDVTANKDYVEAAEQLYMKLSEQVEKGLVRSQKSYPQKYLEDYVFTAYAFWQWHKYKKEKGVEQRVNVLINTIEELFISEHGWKETDATLIPFPGELKNIKDGNLPSAEVVYLGLLQQRGLEEKVKAGNKSRNIMKADRRIIGNPLEYSSLIIFRALNQDTQPKRSLQIN